MKNKAFYLLAMLLSFVWTSGSAQLLEDPMTVSPAGFKAFLKLRDNPAGQLNAESNAHYNVPILFHVIRRTNGTGGLTTTQLDAAVDAMNVRYAPVKIHFYRCLDPNFINDDALFTLVKSNAANTGAMISANNNASMLNIYCCNDLVWDDDSGLCGLSNFPWDSGRWILMDNGCLQNGSTLSHEVGHYFGLLHTQETANGSEHVARSGPCQNCGSAGDGLCDTPADLGLSDSKVNSSCIYTANETENCNGTTWNFTPDPTNLMSYSRKSCRTFFSAGQYGVILNSYLTVRRAQLDTTACTNSICHTDVSLPESGSGNVASPKTVRASSSIASVEKITAAAPGVRYTATRFVQLNPGFSASFGSVFQADNEGCALPFAADLPNSFSNQNDGELVLKTNELTVGESLRAQPNPFSETTQLLFFLENQSSVSLKIVDARGSVVAILAENESFSAGQNRVEFDASQLPDGLFFAQIETPRGRLTTRLVHLKQ